MGNIEVSKTAGNAVLDITEIRKLKELYKSNKNFLEILKKLEELNWIDQETVKSINDTLKKISSNQWNLIKVDEYMWELYELIEKKSTLTSNVKTETQQELISLEEWNLAKRREFLNAQKPSSIQSPNPSSKAAKPKVETNKLNLQEKAIKEEIGNIDFNGSDNLESIREKVNSFLEGEIESWNLTREEAEILNAKIEQILKDKREAEEIALNNFEKVFNNLAQNIKAEWDKFYLEFELNWQLEKRYFNSREEAMQAILEMKKSFEKELESTWIYVLSTIIGNTLWLGKKFYSWAASVITSPFAFGSLEWFLFAWQVALTLALWTLFVWIHFQAYESIKRRAFSDFLDFRNKYSKEYKDEWKSYQVWTVEYKEYQEVQKREEIMKSLREKLSFTQGWTEEYSKLEAIIKKLEKYQLNKTKTFEILFVNYVEYYWDKNDKYWRLANGLKDIFLRWYKIPFIEDFYNPKKIENLKGKMNTEVELKKFELEFKKSQTRIEDSLKLLAIEDDKISDIFDILEKGISDRKIISDDQILDYIKNELKNLNIDQTEIDNFKILANDEIKSNITNKLDLIKSKLWAKSFSIDNDWKITFWGVGNREITLKGETDKFIKRLWQILKKVS